MSQRQSRLPIHRGPNPHSQSACVKSVVIRCQGSIRHACRFRRQLVSGIMQADGRIPTLPPILQIMGPNSRGGWSRSDRMRIARRFNAGFHRQI